MPKAKTPQEKKYIALKIELDGTDIKRTIVVPANTDLETMHYAINKLFGWDDSHLWVFSIGREASWGNPMQWEGDRWGGSGCMDALKAVIGKVLPERGMKMLYTYDMGDTWEHKITRMADPKEPGTRCIKTEGLMGMEDCGGCWGLNVIIEDARAYEKNRKAKLSNPEMFEWSGLEDDEARAEFLTPPTVEELTDTLREAIGA